MRYWPAGSARSRNRPSLSDGARPRISLCPSTWISTRARCSGAPVVESITRPAIEPDPAFCARPAASRSTTIAARKRNLVAVVRRNAVYRNLIEAVYRNRRIALSHLPGSPISPRPSGPAARVRSRSGASCRTVFYEPRLRAAITSRDRLTEPRLQGAVLRVVTRCDRAATAGSGSCVVTEPRLQGAVLRVVTRCD